MWGVLAFKVIAFLYCYSWKQMRRLFKDHDSGQRENKAAANATCANKALLVGALLMQIFVLVHSSRYSK